MELSFIDPKLMRRIERSPMEKDLLRGALGKDKKLRILDATAGLCRDALRMAYWGHEVWACERDQELSVLLTAAFAEAKTHDFYSPWLERLHFFPDATEEFLKKNSQLSFDIVIIDSMFPDDKRKGLPKKEMQNLKALLHTDEDNAEELLNYCWSFAWKNSPKKILVKRPLKAPPFKAHKASHEFKGRAHRWDLYLP